MRLLDFFCCAGGAASGYKWAGFSPYGIDLFPQPRYPFPFHKGDALEVMELLLGGFFVDFTHPDGTVEWLRLSDFAAAHGSPPCQAFSAMRHMPDARVHAELIDPTREAFEKMGLPWVIENVVGAPAAWCRGSVWVNVWARCRRVLPPPPPTVRVKLCAGSAGRVQAWRYPDHWHLWWARSMPQFKILARVRCRLPWPRQKGAGE